MMIVMMHCLLADFAYTVTKPQSVKSVQVVPATTNDEWVYEWMKQ